MDSSLKRKVAQIEEKKQSLLNDTTELCLTRILKTETCTQLIGKCRPFRERVYTPFKTICVFMKQVLSTDKSCKKAVAGLAVEHLISKKKSVSTNTGPYCKARQRLPESIVKSLVKEISKSSESKVPSGWKPYGRALKAFDGTTVKMADTPENQADYPQHGNQKKGCGFPMLRLLAVMSLSMGTVVDYAVGAYKGKGTGEQSLLREVFSCIEIDDIVLGDRYFPSFFLMADLKNIGADGIFRGQAQRHDDFRTGERIGKYDHIASWKKPKKPTWMKQEQYDAYPDLMPVREFKVAGNVYVTTFLDAKTYPKQDLAKIYCRRWDIEINLRSIKSIMEMDMLSCKTPAMVLKEIGIHFLAYNGIRLIMAEACVKHDALPWQVSFKGTVQLIDEFMPHFLNSSDEKSEKLYNEMLRLVVKNKVGNRPGRVEPRVIKQRSKPFPTMQIPRTIAKTRLEKNRDKLILKHAEA